MMKTSVRSGVYERLSVVDHEETRAGFFERCIPKRNITGAIFMLSFISLTSAIWLAFELPILLRDLRHSRLVLIVGVLSILYTYVYFFRSMCTDPGTIQRPSASERAVLNAQLRLDRLPSEELNHLIYDIKVKNVLIKCKYCVTCRMLRSPRSSHCPLCSRCIAMRDHHCPFLSTCIGMRNYRFFVLFLLCLLHTDLFFFITSLVKMRIDTAHARTLLRSLPDYFILIVTGVSALYICNLLGYHWMISARALTTREDDKGIYTHENPFDARRWYRNLSRRLCTSLPPSASESVSET